jgi:two-component system sensor histidine kinase TctE
LQRLGQALRRRDPRDLTPVSVSTPREIGPFVASINHFMGRLDERVTILQHFVADAAHQIRTPLTALSAQVDLLGQARLDASAQQHLARVQERAAELARLTNQLLSHAMVIHRADAVEFQTLDLTDVARRAFRAAIPTTVDPEIVVSFEGPDEPAIVSGDGVSLREAIVNVIDNALRHGVRSSLAIRVAVEGREARVEVEDDGPGIPPTDWSHVTRRFGTAPSREGSAGLGFAIAAKVMVAHGGALRFAEKGARGFTVILSLPRMIEGDRC